MTMEETERGAVIINLVAATNRDWVALLEGVFRDERSRFSSPAEYDQELLQRCGRPLLLAPPGLGARFHIYPPFREEG